MTRLQNFANNLNSIINYANPYSYDDDENDRWNINEFASIIKGELSTKISHDYLVTIDNPRLLKIDIHVEDDYYSVSEIFEKVVDIVEDVSKEKDIYFACDITVTNMQSIRLRPTRGKY